MTERKTEREQSYGHPPTEASRVVRSPNTMRDTRTLAGEYLTQRPNSAKRS